jgi:hypothetical protein
MRYVIEYLTETTEEHSVCLAMPTDGELARVEAEARVAGPGAAMQFGADGFQIRDLNEGGRIVVLSTFEEPLWRFWPETGQKVVH